MADNGEQRNDDEDDEHDAGNGPHHVLRYPFKLSVFNTGTVVLHFTNLGRSTRALRLISCAGTKIWGGGTACGGLAG